MWRNYLTVGIRALAKNRTYAFINIFGLTIGLAACLLIFLFVRYHISYDSWLPHSERTFQLQSERVATEEPPTFTQRSFYPAAAAIEKDFSQIENVTAAWATQGIVLKGGQASYADMLMAEADFFDLIQVPFVRGSRASALKEVDALVLTESEARRHFGNADPLGRTLSVVRRGVPAELRVTGVIKDLPGNTHLALPMVTRLSPAIFADDPQALERWNSIPAYVYVRLRAGADAAAINAALPAWEKRTIPVDTIGSGQMSRADRWALHLENVRDVHLGAFQESAMTPGSDRTTIATFAVVALLILGIACVNFTNLATARASRRAREVALRKVLGAQRRQLVAQFLGESVMMSCFALIVALAIVEISLPAFNNLLGTRLELHYLGSDGALLPMLALTLLVGIAGGLYPAFYLSSFRPSAVLRANQQGGGSSRLRNLLVLAQFAVSIALIICTAVVYLQTLHLRTADTGYEREGLLVVKNLNRKQVEPSVETILQQVARLPGVLAVGRSDITPAADERSTISVQLPGRTDLVMIGSYNVDSGFFKTMGIRTAAGRSFSERFANDDSTDNPPPGAAVNVIVNASGAKQLGFSSPAAAVGAQLRIDTLPMTIVGVVPDVQYHSLREEIEPIIYWMTRTGHSSLIVRYSSSEGNRIAEQVGQVWRRQIPDVPFESFFVEDAVAKLYEADEARGYAFAASAALAIIVGCLGLYALAAFSAERRVKEIGLRKVLGARTKDIVQLLVWQFSKPVVLANLIAWPVAWWVMRGWLNGFQDRISLNPALFLLAGLAALAIAVVTVVGQAVKVARAHPIHALRYE
jgi:putative ABC transport system permease protein